MKKVLSLLLALLMTIASFSAIAEEKNVLENKTDDLSLLFERPVHCIFYYLEDDGYKLSSTTIDKIELYTLPANSSYNCTYLYGGKYHTEDNITDDKPFIAVYFTSKNKFGVASSDVIVHYFQDGYEEVTEKLKSEKTTALGIAWNFPGGVGGWVTGLLIGTLNENYPWTISELDVDYLVNTYDPSTFGKKE